jgi:predicted nuclease of restriction endonuclease-like (RecB) superfamily
MSHQLTGDKKAIAFYGELLADIKTRIQRAQNRAVMAANAEMIRMYWDIGRMVVKRQADEGWGGGILARLAKDLKNELPEVKGFSKRNLQLMVQFQKAYPDLFANTQPAVAHLADPEAPARTDPRGEQSTQPLVAQLPWAHNVILIQKVKDTVNRRWYAKQALSEGWSRDTLALMIKSKAHERQGQAVDNFDHHLPEPHAQLARDTLKDPYVFDFLTLDAPFRERELEMGLIEHLERFLMELGAGFAFVGRQVHLAVGDTDFYIDLLFFHLRLRSFIVVDLKIGPFKPEYAGKINFYCNVVDEQYRHSDDNPTIGLILCQDKKRVLAEYALRGMSKPIGVSEYELTRALPEELKSSLPTIDQIESALTADLKPEE